MKINVKNTALITVLLIALAMLSSCSLPFNYTSVQYTLTVPNTLGTYVETLVDIPAEARNSNINYSSVQIDYTVRKQDSVAADVDIYISTDQVDDDSYDSSTSELLISETLGASESSKSGSVESQKLLEALNAKQQYFILGGKNLSAGLMYPIDIDIVITLSGTYALF